VIPPSSSGRSVLILGGTAEARALAAALAAQGLEVTSSLAGRVANPALPAGAVRIGGFGGADGLAQYLRDNGFGAVVDATHPFAARMTDNAVAACEAVGVPLLRLARPGWADHPDASGWRWVDGFDSAATVAGELGNRIFLTTGRTTLVHFRSLPAGFVLVRLVDAPDEHFPAAWQAIRSRGPYTVDGERALLAEFGIDLLVTKDSGGALTAPKLVAARAENVPIVIVRRPATPAGVEQVSSVEEAARWTVQTARAAADYR
jgi:precorrin-6A/cobalt-precorrin-6A reductase